MELLESDDAKSVLLKKSAMHKKELEDEVRLLSENTEKIVTNALIIGGTLAVTYFLVRKFTKKSKAGKRAKVKKIKLVNDSGESTVTTAAEKSDPGIMSQIGSALAAQATVFLLDLAKEKLSTFLQSRLDTEAETTNERS
jgi:hypothetical protein